MKRYPIVVALLAAGVLPLPAQRITTPAYAVAERTSAPMASTHDTFRGVLVHYGKWFSAAGAAYPSAPKANLVARTAPSPSAPPPQCR